MLNCLITLKLVFPDIALLKYVNKFGTLVLQVRQVFLRTSSSSLRHSTGLWMICCKNCKTIFKASECLKEGHMVKNIALTFFPIWGGCGYRIPKHIPFHTLHALKLFVKWQSVRSNSLLLLMFSCSLTILLAQTPSVFPLFLCHRPNSHQVMLCEKRCMLRLQGLLLPSLGGVALWLGRWSLAGSRPALIYTWSMVGM